MRTEESIPNKQKETEGTNKNKKCHVSRFMCHVSDVTCHMSHIACHMSLTPTATHPPPAYSPTMHSRLADKDLKTQQIKLLKIIKTAKKNPDVYRYARMPEVSSPPGSRVSKSGQTDRS